MYFQVCLQINIARNTGCTIVKAKLRCQLIWVVNWLEMSIDLRCQLNWDVNLAIELTPLGGGTQNTGRLGFGAARVQRFVTYEPCPWWLVSGWGTSCCGSNDAPLVTPPVPVSVCLVSVVFILKPVGKIFCRRLRRKSRKRLEIGAEKRRIIYRHDFFTRRWWTGGDMSPMIHYVLCNDLKAGYISTDRTGGNLWLDNAHADMTSRWSFQVHLQREDERRKCAGCA